MVYAKSKQEKRTKKAMKSILCVIVASFVMSMNIKTFVHSGNLIPGGITGLSLLLQRACLQFWHISLPYFVINITLNAIPAAIGFRMVSKRFTGYSVMVIVLNSFLVDLLPGYSITSNPLLIAIFGGLINGAAISIALMGKASSGGTDFIAVYLNRHFNIASWNVILAFNTIILLIAGVLFGFEASLYSIIFQFASTQAIDYLHKKDHQNTLFIITSQPDELEKELLDFTHHGITRFEGKGCYAKETRTLLYTVVSADEVKDVSDFIRKKDPHAFINITKSVGVKGNFYQEPLD